MEHLQGGMITLEHSYTLERMDRRVGFETLYEGVQDPFDKPVWIHVYELEAPGRARHALTERLRQAAELGSELEQPGLLRAIDHGELEEGVPFVITERGPAGPSLRELLERDGTLSIEETALLIERLAELLDPLHRRGRAHGSLQPVWIWLPDEDPQAARLGHVELGFDLVEQRAMEHAVLSPAALRPLPPELFEQDAEQAQLRSGRLPSFDRAGDIWALGALVHTCLTGAHPFFVDEADPSDGMLQLRAGPPRPLAELGVEAEISQVIERALDPNPRARWSSAGALARALKRAAGLAAPPSTPSPEPRPEPSPTPATSRGELPPPDDRRSQITAGAALFALITNLAWALHALSAPPAPAPEPPPAGPTSGRNVVLTSQPPQARVFSLHDDGETPLGETPFQLDPALADGGRLRLRLARDGYRDTLLEVRPEGLTQKVRIILEKRD